MAVNKYTGTNGKQLWYYSVWYDDWTGKRKRKKQQGFKTQREAKEAETSFLNSQKTDIDISFANLVTAYTENRAARVEATTLQNKGHTIDAKHRYGYNPIDRLFLSSKTSLHRDMREYCEISGVRKIKIHELRHSHASHLIELGVPPLTISERLGHEDIKTTLNTYSHLYPNKQKQIADMLTDLMG